MTAAATRIRISVAMATRNGARFLAQQLESIRSQTRPPDEMVVSDDGSEDATTGIVDAFAARSSFPVRLQRNDTPLGSTKNFEAAIGRCTGDVILLADQDDIWKPAKVGHFEALFSSADVGGGFSDATLIDAEGREIGPSLWSVVGFSAAQRAAWARGRAFDVLTVHNVVTGATLGFRAALRERLLPIPDEHQMIHDRWIALILAATSRLDALPWKLVEYRQHAAQQIGATVNDTRSSGARDYALWADQLDLVLRRLRQLGPATSRHGDRLRLSDRIDHLRVRSSLPERHRFPAVLHELMSARYHRYSNGMWSVAKDLFRR